MNVIIDQPNFVQYKRYLVGKQTIDHTDGIISDIINSSIETDKISSDRKKAKITPVFKQGDREDYAKLAYRPISILPLFAKLMENAIS